MAEMIFHEIAVLLLASAFIALVGALGRQPVIVSFIVVGIAVGAILQPSPETSRQIAFLAELGVASLLFLVGLKLDWRLVTTLGPVALATGLGQVAFTSGIGFLIGLLLGLDAITSLYVAVALTFSSTIIIVKLLSDKRELDSLHGQIALGFLIVQDLVVVFAMVALSTLGIGAESDAETVTEIGRVVASLVLAGVGLFLFVRYIADPLMARFARVPELLVIFAIGWAATAASAGDAIGIGKEIGGLAAGVSLGSTPFREMISARLSAMRDFLLLFFFLTVGAMLDLSNVGQDVIRAGVFSLFVLVGNPLIVVLIMVWMGYRARTGFLAGLTVAQISEFSLIFIAMGATLGHVDEAAVGLVTLVGLVTIAMSVYMIIYSHPLYEFMKPVLSLLEFRKHREREHDRADGDIDVILIGLGRFGSQLLARLEDAGLRVLAVDLDPRAVSEWSRQGFRATYGDATEPEFWNELPLAHARWIVLAVPFGAAVLTETDLRSGLLSLVRERGFGGRVALTARDRSEEDSLRQRGADLVLLPFEDAAAAAVRQMIEQDPEANFRDRHESEKEPETT